MALNLNQGILNKCIIKLPVLTLGILLELFTL